MPGEDYCVREQVGLFVFKNVKIQKPAGYPNCQVMDEGEQRGRQGILAASPHAQRISPGFGSGCSRRNRQRYTGKRAMLVGRKNSIGVVKLPIGTHDAAR